MKIVALDGKFKTDDMIHFDELVNKAGESLYEAAWKDNPFTDVEPFHRAVPKKMRKSAAVTEVKISTFIMQDNEPKLFSRIIPFAHAYKDKKDDSTLVLEAQQMLMNIRQKLWSIINKTQLPYSVLLNNGNIIESSDINAGMWLMKPNTIFCTGCFPIKRGAVRLWGRLLFKKEQALECIKNLNKDSASIQPVPNTQSGVEENEDDREDDEIDSRERNSLLKIILIMSIKEHRKQMIEGNYHSIGNKIKGWAADYGIEIGHKNVADKIEKATQLPSWKTYLGYLKEDKKVQ